MTTATLGLSVDSSSAAAAGPALDKMTAASVKAEDAVQQLTRSAGLWVDQAGRVRNATGQFASALEKAQAAAMDTGKAFEQASGRTVAAVQRISTSIDGARFQTAGLAAQFQDIGVTAAMGMSPLMIGLQQGTQLAGQLATMANPIKGLGAAFLSVLSPVSLLTIGLTAGLAAAIQWGMSMLAASGNAQKAMADAAMSLDQVNSAISDLSGVTDDYARSILDTANTQSSATSAILANTEKEFNAKRSLLELELKRQQALIETQRLELASSQTKLGQEVRSKLPTVDMGEAGGYSDPLIGDFVRSPAQANLLDRTQELIDQNPLTDQIKEMRANLELSEVAATKLEEALGVTFEGAVAESIERVSGSTKKAAEELNAFDYILRDVDHLLREASDPFTELQSNMDKLGALLAAGEISWQQYGEAVARANMLAAEGTLSAVGQITGTLAKAFEGNKAFAVANAVVNTAEGVTKALAQGGMFAFPMAAAIAAAGAAQIASILSAKPGSARVAGSSGGGEASTTAAAAQPQARTASVQLVGDYFSRDAVSSLFERLNEELGVDGLQIVTTHKQA